MIPSIRRLSADFRRGHYTRTSAATGSTSAAREVSHSPAVCKQAINVLLPLVWHTASRGVASSSLMFSPSLLRTCVYVLYMCIHGTRISVSGSRSYKSREIAERDARALKRKRSRERGGGEKRTKERQI